MLLFICISLFIIYKLIKLFHNYIWKIVLNIKPKSEQVNVIILTIIDFILSINSFTITMFILENLVKIKINYYICVLLKLKITLVEL